MGNIRTDRVLVESNNKNHYFAHFLLTRCQCFSRDWNNCWLVAETLLFPARTIKSAGYNATVWRKLSLQIRLMRLRETASFAFFFDIARPSLAWLSWFFLASTVKNASLDRSAWSKTALKSSALSRRLCRLNLCAFKSVNFPPDSQALYRA